MLKTREARQAARQDLLNMLEAAWQQLGHDIDPYVDSNAAAVDVLVDRAFDRMNEQQRATLHEWGPRGVARVLKLK